MKNIDLVALNTLVEKGYISQRPHPSNELFIYNYTPKTQYENLWTPETKQCRGLILTKDHSIIARPFIKFFNVQEHQGLLLSEPFEVYEKLDGSLGILYWYKDEPFIASRGSFTSEQAIKANELLKSKYSDCISRLNPKFTYLFEIIYPSNRIVVDYGNEESLILIGIIETASGVEQPLESIGFPVVKRYDGVTDLASIFSMNEQNKEGFVICFEGGLRLKFKFEDYVKVHRLLTQVTSKVIWEMLRDKIPFDDIIERVPDEFYDWIKTTKSQLQEAFLIKEAFAKETFFRITSVVGTSNRKELAEHFKRCPNSSILFALLDNKDYSRIIWKSIKPVSEKPFLDTWET